jgi:hypothetical protein
MVKKLALLLLSVGVPAPAQDSHDLVVYGATAAGVTTAISGARHGLKTVLLEPGRHVGGMSTGGLSRTDVGTREVIGGMALEFYQLVGDRYEMRRYNHAVAWFYEPRIGEAVMRQWLRDSAVTAHFGHRLRERDGVVKDGARIVEIVTEDGARFRGTVFADCSYEGDLMAQANVRYTWGREGVSTYGESLAGVRDRTPFHQFMVDVPARDANGSLLPEVSSEPAGDPGTADRRVQAYNFRVIATDEPANRLPWTRPDGYTPARYALLARLLEATTAKKGRAPIFNEVALIARIPNGKADINNNGAFSTDYIGGSRGYPEGSYQRRAALWKEHLDYVQGLFHFLANDPTVPASLRAEVGRWGPPRDEFEDTGHWPHQLYVREARRMVGEYVMTQKDLQTDRIKPDVIGMGSYNSDSHNVQRFVNARGMAENEGDMQVPVQPYQIPYRMLLPKAAEASNLLVPVAFSASHVAYSSLRMEPQYMIGGHAAGVAAWLAVRDGRPVQAIDIAELQDTLRQEAAVFDYTPNAQQEALRILREKHAPPPPAPFVWE